MFSSPLVRRFCWTDAYGNGRARTRFFMPGPFSALDPAVTASPRLRAPHPTELVMSTRRELFQAAGLSAAALSLSTSAPSASAAVKPQRSASGWLRVTDGTELFVRDWGQGRPVIATHAWPMSADCWDQIAVQLVDAGFRVITYDRR